MNVIKFRIENYKSVVDSGWCQLANDITILAGKNESGKTAILEALRDFGPEVETIPDQALPINAPTGCKPKITVCFGIEAEKFQKFLEEKNIELGGEAYEYMYQEHANQNENTWSISIYKDSEGYQLDEAFRKILNVQTEQRVQQIKDLCESMAKNFNLQCPDIDTLREDLRNLETIVRQFIQEVLSCDNEYDVTDLQTLNEELAAKDYASHILGVLIKNIQPFVFFNDFSNILPFEIHADSAGENEAFSDFAQVAGLDLDEFSRTTDRQRRRNMLSACSASISGNFHEYWQQDQLNLKVETDGDFFRVGVENEGETNLFSLEQRSKGFQWFMSFYLRLRATGAKPGIILIDEPGMYLHAQAQSDVLKTLEDLSATSTIIFSTHSPYLIDHHRLDRIRLIQKNNTGTVIENKIHRNTNTETLSPIMTAIGLDLSSSGFSIAGQKNVLLEGISDYYYLQALRSGDFDEEIKFIPCVGATKIPQLASLLIGWGLPFHVLLDNDKKGRTVRNNLQKSLPDPNLISFVSSESDTAIEDLFTDEDFNKFIINDPNVQREPNIRNATHLSKEGLNKVLLAKNFFEKIKQDSSVIDQLQPETKNRFRKILTAISGNLSE